MKFKAMFDAQMKQWDEEEIFSLDKKPKPKVIVKAPAKVGIYQEKGNHRVIGNKIMLRALDVERQYVNHNIKLV